MPNLSTIYNLILKSYRFKILSNGVFLNNKKITEFSEKLINEFNISVPNKFLPVKFLSGGNIQKVVLAREFIMNPKL